MAQYPAPVYPTWGESLGRGINEGFDNIMQGMRLAQQKKMQNLAFQGQTGFDPDALTGGKKIAQQFAGTELTPQNAGNVITPQQNDMWQQFQQFTNQGRASNQAKTADIQSQTNLRNAQATYYGNKSSNPTPGSANNMTPDEWKALTDAAYAHPERFPSDLLTARGPKAKFIAQAVMKNPDYDPTAGNISYGAAKSGAAAGARLTEGGSSQVVARTANSAKEQLGILQQVSQDFPRSDIQAMNTPLIAIDKQTYPNAQNWVTAVNGVRYEYATALARGNKPGEQDLHEAAQALPDNITPAQLESVIPLMGRLIDATVKGQMTPAGLPSTNKSQPKQNPASKGGQRQVQLVGQDGKPRTALYNGQKFAGWADGGK